MPMRDDFAVFILSHGRANRIHTLTSLKKGNYTGKWYVVIDDEDDEEPEYRKRFGDHVRKFCKKDLMQTTDTLDNFEKHGAVVYARNYCHTLARELGLKYFLVLDDDYSYFACRKITPRGFSAVFSKQLDRLFTAMVDYMSAIPALSITFAQCGDYIGGPNGSWKCGIKRKAMNTFFCATDRPFQFMGSINEDLNASVLLGMRGGLFMTIMKVCVCQHMTQSNENGLTTIYKDLGTFVKSFYSVIVAPSCVKISVLGDLHKRIHHKVAWNNAVQCIVSDRLRKDDPCRER